MQFHLDAPAHLLKVDSAMASRIKLYIWLAIVCGNAYYDVYRASLNLPSTVHDIYREPTLPSTILEAVFKVMIGHPHFFIRNLTPPTLTSKRFLNLPGSYISNISGKEDSEQNCSTRQASRGLLVARK